MEKKNRFILAKEGYLIPKKDNEQLIKELKNELTVVPFLPFNQSRIIKPVPFSVYLENDKYLCIPKYYGISKFGQPVINKEINGEIRNIEFKGILRENQLNIINTILPKIHEEDGGLLSLGCGGGKCLAINTEILMYDGSIKKVQDIIVGDKLMGDDSKQREVLKVSQGIEMMYKIHIGNSGESYTVNESHILSLKTKDLKIFDISVKDYLKLDNKEKYFGYRVSIDFEEKETEIEPYTYGYNLSLNESIPLNYKCNSKEKRLQLLAGIIDSFGYYCMRYYKLRVATKIKKDILYIIRSLGLSVFVKNDYITIYSHENIVIPVLIKKKLVCVKSILDNLLYKIRIEKLKEDRYYGFEITGNRRFVLSDMTVTHNTVLSLYIACQLKVKTLVIVHKSFLLNQWKERAQEFTNASIGIIQQNKIEIDGKDIVIGMLQSIAKDKYDSDVFRDFGFVIFDEAHHAPSNYFSRALPIISAKKTLALSATPERNDRLEKVLYWYFGNILYKAPTNKIDMVLVKIYKYSSNDDEFKEYMMRNGLDINRAKTINKLTEIKNRNIFILNEIKKVLEEEERKILILSDRINHLDILKIWLDELNLTTTSYYIGGMKQNKLDESAKAKVIFSTYSMSSEALDIPELNTLFLLTPRKEVEQSVGRITRKLDHPVQPLVIDIIDQLPSFVNQGYSRKRLYNNLGFQIKTFEVNETEIIKEVKTKSQPKTFVKINPNDIDFID